MQFRAYALGVAVVFAISAAAQTSNPAAVETTVADTTPSSADKAWQELNKESMSALQRTASNEEDVGAIRTSLAGKAQRFYSDFPQDSRAGIARKIEIDSRLRDELAGGRSAADLTDKIASYLADTSQPATDRFDVSNLAKEVRLRRRGALKWPEERTQWAVDAWELIEEFPEDGRGYGYLLSAAKAQEKAEAGKIARELLQSTNAPDYIKAGAQRVVDRFVLENKPLSLTAPGLNAASLHGSPVIVYSWTTRQSHILERIMRLAELGGVAFVGVNLDTDREAAEKMVRVGKVPGLQVYDGGGMDGPVARQLHLTMTSSMTLVDSDGVVIDVNAHEDIEGKLREFFAAKGGRK